jgi:ElaB/YqjD/DUF883 family membrane-anchored ribosome-binding protein
MDVQCLALVAKLVREVKNNFAAVIKYIEAARSASLDFRSSVERVHVAYTDSPLSEPFRSWEPLLFSLADSALSSTPIFDEDGHFLNTVRRHSQGFDSEGDSAIQKSDELRGSLTDLLKQAQILLRDHPDPTFQDHRQLARITSQVRVHIQKARDVLWQLVAVAQTNTDALCKQIRGATAVFFGRGGIALPELNVPPEPRALSELKAAMDEELEVFQLFEKKVIGAAPPILPTASRATPVLVEYRDLISQVERGRSFQARVKVESEILFDQLPGEEERAETTVKEGIVVTVVAAEYGRYWNVLLGDKKMFLRSEDLEV